MDFMHKITSVLTGFRFYFHSLVPCLLAVSLAFYICFVGTITVEAEDQKRVIGQYGGSVSIESEAGHGATFFFTLPKKGEKNE